ncbi:hypothetical protein EVA_00898 [gut metagenome]|uniref:Uncharacterized protein n=1 Tax=gut metagenome TaxID=749906 RepID=J9GRT2_9ZZZZ
MGWCKICCIQRKMMISTNCLVGLRSMRVSVITWNWRLPII